MRDVAGVDHEGWLRRHCLDLADCLFERAIDVGVRGLLEPHVAVADLQEGERACALRHRLVHKPKGARYAASDCPEDAGPGPGHAFENFAAVNAIVIMPIGAHFCLREASLLHETRSAEPQIYSRKNRLLAKARSSERFALETRHESSSTKRRFEASKLSASRAQLGRDSASPSQRICGAPLSRPRPVKPGPRKCPGGAAFSVGIPTCRCNGRELRDTRRRPVA